jgi:hypothetical protein
MGALCVLSAGQLYGISYNVSLNTAYFGWLDQYDLDTYKSVGYNGCVPTSSTNAMTYLQNAYSGYFGTSLTGTTYQNRLDTAEQMVNAMGTDENGTQYNRVPYALSNYIITEKGFTQTVFGGMYLSSDYWSVTYPNPGYITDSAPTSGFFLDSLGSGAATLFSIYYPETYDGHYLLATSLVWDDVNNDGIIQKSEDAHLSFVDPLDPAYYDSAGYPDAGPKLTVGQIYYDEESATLLLDYYQYEGELPYDENNYTQWDRLTINTVFSINVVPEPQTWAMLAGLATLGLCLARKGFRRKAAPTRMT